MLRLSWFYLTTTIFRTDKRPISSGHGDILPMNNHFSIPFRVISGIRCVIKDIINQFGFGLLGNLWRDITRMHITCLNRIVFMQVLPQPTIEKSFKTHKSKNFKIFKRIWNLNAGKDRLQCLAVKVKRICRHSSMRIFTPAKNCDIMTSSLQSCTLF